MKTFFITSDSSISPMPYIDQLNHDSYKYGIQVEADNISDGYHTMHELYQHRMALNIALFNLLAAIPIQQYYGGNYVRVMKSKLHYDGTMFDGEYFIVMAIVDGKQISYHYKLKHWDKFIIPEVERTPKWDGHNSLDVLERLMKL